MKLWRVSKHTDLSGIGGTLASGRWHSRGRPVVYLAEHPSLAILEVIVNLEIDRSECPRGFFLIEVEAPDRLPMASVSLADLPPDWPKRQDVTRRVGDSLLQQADTALIKVPSAVVPDSWNYLLNPAHAEAAKAKVAQVTPDPFDARLFP